MQSQSLIIQKEGNSLYPLLFLFNLKHFFVDQHCNYKTFLLSHSRIEQSPAVFIRVVVVYGGKIHIDTERPSSDQKKNVSKRDNGGITNWLGKRIGFNTGNIVLVFK
jgi:hypothetical protein